MLNDLSKGTWTQLINDRSVVWIQAAKSTLTAARLPVYSGCFSSLCLGIECELLVARALHKVWLPGGASVELKLDEDPCRQESSENIGLLDDLWLSGSPTAILNPHGKFRMREGGPRHPETWIWILDLPVIMVTNKLLYGFEFKINHCIDLAVWTLTSYLTSLCLTSFIYKMEIINKQIPYLVRGLQRLNENLFKGLCTVFGK